MTRHRQRHQHHRGRGAEVQRFGLAIKRDGDDAAAAREDVRFQATRLLPNQHGFRSLDRRLVRSTAGRLSGLRSSVPYTSAAQTSILWSPVQVKNSSVLMASTGRWNREPAVERMTLGFSTSTQSSTKITASQPAASAARITVPALPGRAPARRRQSAGPDRSCQVRRHRLPACMDSALPTAAMPWASGLMRRITSPVQ